MGYLFASWKYSYILLELFPYPSYDLTGENINKTIKGSPKEDRAHLHFLFFALSLCRPFSFLVVFLIVTKLTAHILCLIRWCSDPGSKFVALL